MLPQLVHGQLAGFEGGTWDHGCGYLVEFLHHVIACNQTSTHNERYIHPLTILVGLPSAAVGALIKLWMFNMDLSIIATIGIVMLICIVKKNAIMMIDFALDAQRTKGMTLHEAIRTACLLRFRPIMMTTLAALMGAMPLAFGWGAGAELRQPLGLAVVGGLLFSQVITIFITPVIYLYLDRWAGTGPLVFAVEAAARGGTAKPAMGD